MVAMSLAGMLEMNDRSCSCERRVETQENEWTRSQPNTR